MSQLTEAIAGARRCGVKGIELEQAETDLRQLREREAEGNLGGRGLCVKEPTFSFFLVPKWGILGLRPGEKKPRGVFSENTWLSNVKCYKRLLLQKTVVIKRLLY